MVTTQQDSGLTKLIKSSSYERGKQRKGEREKEGKDRKGSSYYTKEEDSISYWDMSARRKGSSSYKEESERGGK